MRKPGSPRLPRRRFLHGVTALIASPVAATVLAACGSTPAAPATSAPKAASSSGTPTSKNPAPATAPTATPQPAAAAAGASAEKVTLRFYTDETDPPSIKVYHAVAQAYSKEHPNVTVSVSPVSGDSMAQKVATAIAAKTAPEIAKQTEAAYMQLAVQGFLTPIDPWVDQIGRKDFKPNSLYVIKGKTYNFPYAGGGYGQIWYRTDLFDQAGLKPPTTWDEWKNAAQKLTKGSMHGFTTPGAKSGCLDVFISQLIWSSGGTYFDDKLNVAIDGKSQDAMKQALEFYKEMTAYAPPSWPSIGWDGNIDSFLSKQSAMIFYAGRPLERAQQNAPDLLPKMKAFRLPKSRAGYHAHYDHYDSYVLFTKAVGSKDPQAAGDFTKYLITGEPAIQFLHTVPGHLSPPLYSIDKNPKLWDNELMQSHKDSVDLVFRPGGLYYLTEAGAKPNDAGEMRGAGIFNLYGGPSPARDVPAEMVQRFAIQKQSIAEVIKWAAGEFRKDADALKKQISPAQFGYQG